MSSVLPVASSRARAPSGIVTFVLPCPIGMLPTAGMPSGAISSSRISSIESVDSLYSGIVWPRRLTSVPNTNPAALANLPASIRWLRCASIMYGSSLRSSSITMQPSVSISYGVPRLAATSVRQPPTIGASATPSPTVSTYGSSGSSGTRPSGSGLEGLVERLLGDLGQLVLLAREAQEGGAVERDPVAVLGERQVERGDVAVAAEDARVAERVPVDVLVQPPGAVAAVEAQDHVDPGLGQRPLHVGGALGVGAGEVAVHVAVVGPELQRVAAALEVVRGLLDPGPLLRRARRRGDGDGAALGQRGWLDPHDGGGADMTSTRWPAGSLTNQRGAFQALLPSCGSKPC